MEKHFGCCRYIFNRFLKEKQDHYLNNGKTLNYNNCAGMMKILKDEDETQWLKEVNAQSLQQALMNLETAYGNFFRKKTKFPRFKKKSNHQSFRVPQNIKVFGNKISVNKFRGGIIFDSHRKLEGEIKSATFSRTPSNKYFVSILCEVPKKSKPKTGKSIGIDLGITDFIVTSDGEKIKNPNFNRKQKPALSKAQKHLSRKTKGSNRYNKQRVKVARIHEKITNSRRDFQHKLSTRLINEYDMIALETLAVKNMVKNRHLAYSISDSGWYSFVEMLSYKALWYGKTIAKIDRWYPSSKTCSSCDYVIDKLPLSVRKWTCPRCSCEHDRDINASKNILRQGLNVYSLERCLTNVEGKALASGNTGETDPCEALKKKSQTRLKPLAR
jgi:putative transposase